MRRRPLPVLQLEESPYFVSLYDSTQRGRLDAAVKLPLYPFAFGWLLVLERWRGWHGRGLRVRGLTARPNRLEATLQVGRLVPRHHASVPSEAIERLTVAVGPEGEREVPLTLRVRYQDRSARPLRGEASFVVADVDTHREAMALLIRLARKLGATAYRTLPGEDAAESFVVELLFPTDEARAHGYRDPGRPADVRPIPDHDEIEDFEPRRHGGFVEPEGEDIPAPRPERVGIETFELGRRVVAGRKSKPWAALLIPLLVVGGLILWILLAVVSGTILGLVGALVSIAASFVGLNLWSIVTSGVVTTVTLVVSAIVALVYAVPPAVVLLRQTLGGQVTIDWRGDRVEQHDLLTRMVMPLSHVRGVDVRASMGQRRLLLRTSEGDVVLATGDDDLTPVAVALARSLDVPVTYPDRG